jgi:hypothetical protein
VVIPNSIIIENKVDFPNPMYSAYNDPGKPSLTSTFGSFPVILKAHGNVSPSGRSLAGDFIASSRPGKEPGNTNIAVARRIGVESRQYRNFGQMF